MMKQKDMSDRYQLVPLQPPSSKVHICSWELQYNGKFYTIFWIALVLGNLDQYLSQVLMQKNLDQYLSQVLM